MPVLAATTAATATAFVAGTGRSGSGREELNSFDKYSWLS